MTLDTRPHPPISTGRSHALGEAARHHPLQLAGKELRVARNVALDASRGACMLAVIFGHVIGNSSDAGLIAPTSIWQSVFFVLYNFHMAAFFMLAGLTVQRRLQRPSKVFCASVAKTLVWPYLVWAMIVLSAMHLSGNLRNAAGTMTFGLYLLWTPVAWLWFLVALTIFHGLAWISRGRPMIILTLGVAAYAASPLIHNVILYEGTHFLIFYGIGFWLGPRQIERKDVPPAIGVAATAGLISSELILLPLHTGFWSPETLPAAFAGAVTVIWLGYRVRGRLRVGLAFIGERTLAIYVCHIFSLPQSGSRSFVCRAAPT